MRVPCSRNYFLSRRWLTLFGDSMNARPFFSLCLAFSLALFPISSPAQRGYPPTIPGATGMVYKTIDDVELKLWIFNPEGHQSSDRSPAILFFFGGGWKGGSPSQFVPQAKRLAEKGMVAMVADYRVRSRHGTLARTCVEDARDAMRFVRSHAETLGIDPNRVAAGGGSAGGHIAACLGTIDTDEGSKPNALALFNPACVLAPLDGKNYWEEDRHAEMKERMGVEPEALSPAHHVSSEAPPCILFHGEADPTVPFATAEVFADRMKAAGVRCDLMAYPGEAHGFFNPGRGKKAKEGPESPHEKTLEQLVAFLVDLGWIK